jgi:hypothetical protein
MKRTVMLPFDSLMITAPQDEILRRRVRIQARIDAILVYGFQEAILVFPMPENRYEVDEGSTDLAMALGALTMMLETGLAGTHKIDPLTITRIRALVGTGVPCVVAKLPDKESVQ